MSKQANQPAFPGDHQSGNGPGLPGLTKREYFASMAMQGVLSCADDQRKGSLVHPDDVAMVSVNYADALLAELEKE